MNSDVMLRAQPWLRPQWPAIDGVHALMTTRHGGSSHAPWDSMNLGDHVGDAAQHVAANRQLLRDAAAQLAQRPVQAVFLQQVHGCDALVLQPGSADGQAFDACVSTTAGVACTIMVADCLPVLLAHRGGRAVAAAHAGWRGLAGVAGEGVLERTWQAYAQALGQQPDALLAAQTQVWLGPCIGPQAFEVGAEVREVFAQSMPGALACFRPSGNAGRWWADLPALARLRLGALGLQQVYGNDGSDPWCTVTHPSQFFSHRRDAAVLGSTGRMAACIWLG